MSTYQATTPPPGATCDTPGDCTVAVVRLVIPPSRFTADGVDHSDDPQRFDACEYHWRDLRDTVLRHGHEIVDATGDLAQLTADFPRWRIFRADEGRLYASTRLPGHLQGITVYAWLVGHLRAQMRAVEDPQVPSVG